MTEPTEKTTESDRELPSGQFARARIAGMMVAKVGAQRLGRAAKKALGGTEAADAGYESEARMVFEALSRMRGPALKLAQTLSMENDWLPEAYTREFEKAHYQVPALSAAVVRRLLTVHLGKPPEEVFQSFEPDAFAAASLGQVHRATARDGSLLAVKVQYPGVREAVQADLSMGRRLLAPFLRSPYVSKVMKELEARFIEEVDYYQELTNTLWFRERLKQDGLRVPQPYPQLSTATVLTTELIPGKHVGEWLSTNPPQEAVDRAAQTLWDVFCLSFFELGRMHADPNPGNYLFAPDGAIGMIDFGCVKLIPTELSDTVARYMRAELQGDRAVIQEMLGRLGVDLGQLSEDGWSVLVRMGHLKSLPFQEESFDFRNPPFDPEEMAKMTQAAREFLKRGSFDGQTTETVMFNRNLRGLFNIFQRMRARVRLRNRWIH
jgi:predicted unusual protein kinase regulating ubiquinone biosynthesis (AarF/ABC1/UbiB family)